MKTAEQITSRIARSWKEDMSSETLQTQIANGLKEYGELVRQRAAGVAGRAATEYEATKEAHERNIRKAFDHREFGFNMDVVSHSQYCAAAIERMELP